MDDYKKLIELAERIINIDFYGARDAEETPGTIVEKLIYDPLTIIEYLVDVVEDYQAGF